MPLVDYESSEEESENESAEKFTKNTTPNADKRTELVQNEGDLENTEKDNNATLFAELPKPRTQFSFLGDDNKLSKLLLNKNISNISKKSERTSIKISIPSVSEFDDEKNEPTCKKLKPSVKGTGLFSILPPPKNISNKETSRTLLPRMVAKKEVKQTVHPEAKTETPNNNTSPTKDIDMDMDEDITEVNFFGSVLSEPSSSEKQKSPINVEINPHMVNKNETPVYHEPESSLMWPKSLHVKELNSSVINTVEHNMTNTVAPNPEEIIPVENNPLNLDEKALQILCGNKKKRQHMPMNIIDLSGEEIMPDSKEWLLKQFTEEKKVRGPSRRKGEGPSSLQRRKHQITYLAYQAKEQELELQNQWANNRMSRKQTQSKYGF